MTPSIMGVYKGSAVEIEMCPSAPDQDKLSIIHNAVPTTHQSLNIVSISFWSTFTFLEL
jgi:hypothetical protein